MTSAFNDKTESERIKLFMDGLSELSRQTGVEVTGCGCCDSPYLVTLSDGDIVDQSKYHFKYEDDVDSQIEFRK